MEYDVMIDFSALDRIVSRYSIRSDEAESILSIISEFFATLLDYFLYLIDGVGFLWIFAATLFIVAVARLVIFPFVGGRSIDLGTDRASDPVTSKVHITTTTYKSGKKSYH